MPRDWAEYDPREFDDEYTYICSCGHDAFDHVPVHRVNEDGQDWEDMECPT